ncbi:MAG TPA: MBL fold metallo-hydrolase, partial [Gemmatimonadaceae bacterium]|nr:MBL fold metallo-hydrolase [Gemmatimonadaceae bacterium]
ALASAWTGVMGLREMQGFAYADTPDLPITHDTTLVLGGRTLVIGHPGAPHTAGDLYVWLLESRVLFAGDILIEDGVTLVADGSSGDLLSALDTLEALRPAAVVPGHGRIPADPAALIDATRCYTLALRERMRTAVDEGVRMGQALESLPPPDRDRPVSRASRQRRDAVRVYSEMERSLMTGSAKPGELARERERLKECGGVVGHGR